MSIDERLARALDAEADRIEVDLQRLHAQTRSRLRRTPPRRRFRLAVPVAAAALVLTVLGALALPRIVAPDSGGGPAADAPLEGGVDTRFSCPAQVTADQAARTVDDALLVDLAGGPAQAARSLEAPRFAYSEDGDRALLRLGNADGTLAATATFRRVGRGEDWVLDTTRRCVGRDNGISVPGTDELRLGRREATPYPARRFSLDPATAVFLDDRTTYDQSGFARHRSVWAAPCGRRACVVGGTPTSHAVGEIAANARPENISGVLVDADAMVGRRAGLVLWAVYDTAGSVTSMVAHHRDGSTRPAVVVRAPGWTGRLLLLLDVPDRVSRVTLRSDDGAEKDYAPAQIAD